MNPQSTYPQDEREDFREWKDIQLYNEARASNKPRERKPMEEKIGEIKPNTRWHKTAPLPEGYGYADRLPIVGETVFIWEDKEWIPVVVRPYTDWLDSCNSMPQTRSLMEKELTGEYPCSTWRYGGFAFTMPDGSVSCQQAIRPKQVFCEETETFSVIGLKDPNPLVCIKTEGGKTRCADDKGLPYYPLTEEEVNERKPNESERH